MATLKPPPKLTVSEWADEYRFLSAESAAEAGKWRTSRTEYMRGIMDAVNDPNVEQITIMSGSQLGKTELILNIIGYFTHYEPCPILLIQPTVDMAKTFSLDRLAPMIRDTPAITDTFAASKGRDSANTMLKKSFIGGNIALIGANSPSQLASRPIRLVLADEVDRYEVTKEGDPFELAYRRTATFLNRKVVAVSTPNTSGSSKIESEYFAGSQGKFVFPCHHCGENFEPIWSQMTWDKNEDGEHLPETAGMECPHCQKRNIQKFKASQVANGTWVHEYPERRNRSFQMGAWVSPFVTYEQVVQDFLDAKASGSETLKVHVNTFHGQPWEEQGKKLDLIELMERQRQYTDKDHESYLITTIGVDIQDNRAEFEVVGWNRQKQSWSLGYEIIHGDPNFKTFWDDLDARLAKYDFQALAIDTGGHHTKNTYRWIANNRGKRYYAIKGRGGEGVPTTSKPTKATAAKGVTIDLYTLGTNAIKFQITEMLSIHQEHGNGYCNFSLDLDKEYFLQLTAEKRVVTKPKKGLPKVEWKKLRDRNEAFDCRCYSYAAVELLQPNWDILEETADMNKRPVDKVSEKQDNTVNFKKLAMKARRNGRV